MRYRLFYLISGLLLALSAAAATSTPDFPGTPAKTPLRPAGIAERVGALHIQLYSMTNHIVWHIANGVTGILLIVLAALIIRFIAKAQRKGKARASEA